MRVNIVLGTFPVIRFKPYVCFSEDGQIAIADPKRTSAIRRRFCKNSWNKHWRQLQEAFCTFLAGDDATINISLNGPETLVLSRDLLQLMAARKMPDDFSFIEESEEPEEPDSDELDDQNSDNDEDPEEAI